MVNGGGENACVGAVRPIPHDVCNGYDDDCNGVVDDMPPRVCGLGACRVEVPACVAGEPNACVPGIPGAEVCNNGIDDDCNGAIDDGCDCVYVSAARGATMGLRGSFATPFREIGPAIAHAANGPTPRSVCVEAGTYPEALTMQNGVHVRGGYDLSGAGPTRPGGLTLISPSTGGVTVTFPDTITATTVLDGFEVRFPSQNLTPNVVVSIGGQGATIVDSTVRGSKVGVLVQGQAGALAQATLARNRIIGCDLTLGATCDEAIGVQGDLATLLVSDHCDTFDEGGRCASATSQLGIWGEFRDNASPTHGTDSAVGVRIVNAPNTLVERSLVLSHTFDTHSSASLRAMGIQVGELGNVGDPATFDADGVRVTQSYVGHGRNNISQVNGLAAGIFLSRCGAAVPLVDNNFRIFAGQTNALSQAYYPYLCGPVLANNLDVSVDGISFIGNLAIRCGSFDSETPCHILDNRSISTMWPVGLTHAILCEGNCGRIEGNDSIVTNYLRVGSAVMESNGDAIIRRNLIEARNASEIDQRLPLMRVFGQARIENNVMRFANSDLAPTARAPAGHLIGVDIRSATVMFLSNTVRFEFGVGPYDQCRSTGLATVRSTLAFSPSVIAVNNLFGSSPCAQRENVDIGVFDPATELRFEHNNLATYAAGDTLFSTPAGAITTLGALEASPDVQALGNLSVDPGFVSADDERLAAGAVCVDTGTPFLSPPIDFTGAPRPQGAGYDIGAFEQ